MLSGDSNLNLLSYDSSANLLNHVLSLGFRVKRILLDALGPAETHLNNLRKRIPALKDKNIEMISESKADFKDNDYGLRLGWGKFYDNEKDARKING
jgi:hypothetical protein